MGIWKLVLMGMMVLPQPKPAPKRMAALIGVWHGKYEQFRIDSNGTLKPLHLNKAPRISLILKANHRGQIIYQDSIENSPPSTSSFTYQLHKNNVIALTTNGLTGYYTVEVTKANKLHLYTYPAPLIPQEDVAIITLIDFYKKPVR